MTFFPLKNEDSGEIKETLVLPLDTRSVCLFGCLFACLFIDSFVWVSFDSYRRQRETG